MTIAKIGIYLAEAGFMGIVFVAAGIASRILWEMRRER